MRFEWGITRSWTATTPSFVPKHQTPADVPSPSSTRPAMWTGTTRVRTTTSPPRGSWEPPSSFVPRYTTVWMDYLKKKIISLDVKDVLVHLVAAVAP